MLGLSHQFSAEGCTCYRASLSLGFGPSLSCGRPPDAFLPLPPEPDLPSSLHPLPAPPVHAPWGGGQKHFLHLYKFHNPIHVLLSIKV